MKSLHLLKILFILGVVITAGTASAQDTPGETVYVQINNARLREQPLHWARSVSEPGYGEALQVQGRNNAWVLAKDEQGRAGYIHESALTVRRVILRTAAPGSEIRTGESEVVLAGKGFNADIERSCAADNKELNYAAVDRVESFKVSDGDLAAFIAEGNLNTKGET